MPNILSYEDLVSLGNIQVICEILIFGWKININNNYNYYAGKSRRWFLCLCFQETTISRTGIWVTTKINAKSNILLKTRLKRYSERGCEVDEQRVQYPTTGLKLLFKVNTKQRKCVWAHITEYAENITKVERQMNNTKQSMQSKYLLNKCQHTSKINWERTKQWLSKEIAVIEKEIYNSVAKM